MELKPKTITVDDIKAAYKSSVLHISENLDRIWVPCVAVLLLGMVFTWYPPSVALSPIILPGCMVCALLLSIALDCKGDVSAVSILKYGLLQNKLLMLFCMLLSLVLILVSHHLQFMYDLSRAMLPELILTSLGVGQTPSAEPNYFQGVLVMTTLGLTFSSVLERMYLSFKFDLTKQAVSATQLKAALANPYQFHLGIVVFVVVSSLLVTELPILLPAWTILSCNLLYFGFKAIYEGNAERDSITKRLDDTDTEASGA